MHKRGDRVELYSRDLKRITGQFPDLARAARSLRGDFIGDGELLAWRKGRALPFAELQKRLDAEINREFDAEGLRQTSAATKTMINTNSSRAISSVQIQCGRKGRKRAKTCRVTGKIRTPIEIPSRASRSL